MSICLIDTSVFCNILRVPNRHQNATVISSQLRQYLESETTLLLPVATIIETGNHIAQNGDGRQRRATAQRFVTVVKQAIDGTAPWTIPQPLFAPEALGEYLDRFPDSAMSGSGLGDLSIIREYERQCKLHPARRIFIWTLDRHLAGHDRSASL